MNSYVSGTEEGLVASSLLVAEEEQEDKEVAAILVSALFRCGVRNGCYCSFLFFIQRPLAV